MGQNFSFFFNDYSIQYSFFFIDWLIYLFHLARLCKTLVVEFISFSEAMWRGNSSFMNWGFHVQKFLFTFFVSNIEIVISQESLQLFTYQIGYYFATIYFRTVHNFQKQLLTGGSNSSKETAKKKTNNLSVSELSLCYSFNYQISKEETIFFNETGQKRKNFRWNLDIPTSLNRDLRNIPFLRGGERGEGGGGREGDLSWEKYFNSNLVWDVSAVLLFPLRQIEIFWLLRKVLFVLIILLT